MIEILLSSLRMSTPLIFVALAGLMSERSGVIQIGLEGMMLLGALSAALTTSFFHNPWLGVAGSALAGLCLANLMAFFALKVRADQIVIGTALNLFAMGLCPLITKMAFDSTGSTPSIPLEERLGYEFVGLAIAVTVCAWWMLKYTRFGLWIQFAGESPRALQAAGLSVERVRWMALSICGVLAGIGGSVLSTWLASSYSPNMTAGRGFMALAALIFGGWRPLPTMGACLLFGFVDAVQMRMQGEAQFIPVSIVQVLPYLFTIIALVGFFGHNRAPKGMGTHV